MTNKIKLYTILCSIFCSIIVSGNLIFQKFVTLTAFGFVWELSAGVLFYPFAFLISDLVTEFYGKEAAKRMVRIAVLCSLFVMFMVFIADSFDASGWSVINNETFHLVFNAYGIGFIASIVANYLGQMVDIHIYSIIKTMTSGRHLWLRNNISTIAGQLIDTLIVVGILCYFSIIPWKSFLAVGFSSFSFKVIAALADTPLCYLGYFLIKKFG